MKLRKIAGFIGLSAVVLSTAFALQGCFETTPGYYSYGYQPPAYAYNYPGYAPAPVYVAPPAGDWDEHHVWHERDWWEEHRRPWIQQYHPEWLAQRNRGHEHWEHHERHDHD